MSKSGWLKSMFADRKAHLVKDLGAFVKTKCGLYLNSRFLQYASTQDHYCKECK